VPRIVRALKFSLAFVAAPALADEVERRAAAEAYVDSPVQVHLMDDMLSTDAIMQQLGVVSADLDPAQLETIAAIVGEELQTLRGDMREAMISGMAETFSLEEITALTAAYSDPVVAGAMRKMNPLMQSTMARLGPSFLSMQSNVAQRVTEALEE